jgi:hypothetical protein
MLRISMVLAALAVPAMAHAEDLWSCNYSGPLSAGPTLIRFQVSGSTLIESQFKDRYSVLENNQYGLIATHAFARIEKDHKQPTIGAFTVVINKATGEFWLATVIAGESNTVNQSVSGMCHKE